MNGKRMLAGLSLLLAGGILAAWGASAGQYAGVFQKAIFVCMECIGLG